MRATLVLLLGLAAAVAALELGGLHGLEEVDRRRTVCHDLKHRKRTLKLIKVGNPSRGRALLRLPDQGCEPAAASPCTLWPLTADTHGCAGAAQACFSGPCRR